MEITDRVLDPTEDYSHVRDKWMRGPGYDRAWDVVPDRMNFHYVALPIFG